MEFQGAKPPRAVHRVMFGLLGPPGRVCGYRGFMPSTATPAAPPQIQMCSRSPGWHYQTRMI